MSNTPRMPTVLLIDDQWGLPEDSLLNGKYGEIGIRWLKATAMNGRGGYSVESAMNRIRSEMPTLSSVLLDLSFGDSDNLLGLDILSAVRAEYPSLPVIVFTSLESRANRETVVRCLELGANEYLVKAPSPQEMRETLATFSLTGLGTPLLGNSTKVRRLRAKVGQIATGGDTSVLVIGESGTGKEVIARMLHRTGSRRRGSFVAKNCASSDMNLLDSELFGHEKGAFTGAIQRRVGLIEESDRGTLFLDEIADMPLELQSKLLRTLEQRTFRRVGGGVDLGSDFQLICATNQHPATLLAAGRLREDFYYRVAAVTLESPPLRERLGDIPMLAEYFLSRVAARTERSTILPRFSHSVLELLHKHGWPGNIRELRNAVEHAAIFCMGGEIRESDLPPFLTDTGTHAGRASFAIAKEMPIGLPADLESWPVARLRVEIGIALRVKEHVQQYKGSHWKAEFMRTLYPMCKAANAKGFQDLVDRWQKGPWSVPFGKWDDDLRSTFAELLK